MGIYMPPWLDQPPHYTPKRKGLGPRLGQILLIAVVVAVVGFFVALITAIVTAGGSPA